MAQEQMVKYIDNMGCIYIYFLHVEHQLGFLHEQLHWIILISAHILADSGKGEQPMIPDSLMHLSASQVKIENKVFHNRLCIIH
jgi:hypothetical protein